MTVEPREPSFERPKYFCPNCGTLAVQHWYALYYAPRGGRESTGIHRVDCEGCSDFQVWLDVGRRMVVPDRVNVPAPNEDLSDDVRADYTEAASILARSPRGSAALLRLALQKLCVQLGEKGDRINDDIKALVEKGLPVRVQQALDVLRVVGNNAVHPGQIDLRDDSATAGSLFNLVNLIAEDRITEPKRVEAMFAQLPVEARAAIEKRDTKTT